MYSIFLHISEKNKTLSDVFLSNGLIYTDLHRFSVPLCRQRKVPTFEVTTNDAWLLLIALIFIPLTGKKDVVSAVTSLNF